MMWVSTVQIEDVLLGSVLAPVEVRPFLLLAFLYFVWILDVASAAIDMLDDGAVPHQHPVE
jgi:hypothetical protein